jgi:hypothetical protein
LYPFPDSEPFLLGPLAGKVAGYPFPGDFGDALIGDNLQKKSAQLRGFNGGVNSVDHLLINNGSASNGSPFGNLLDV